MDTIEAANKLAQIEEQAGYAIAEFPKGLTKERLQMILALARYLRSELQASKFGSLGERLGRPSDNDGEGRRA